MLKKYKYCKNKSKTNRQEQHTLRKGN